MYIMKMLFSTTSRARAHKRTQWIIVRPKTTIATTKRKRDIAKSNATPLHEQLFKLYMAISLSLSLARLNYVIIYFFGEFRKDDSMTKRMDLSAVFFKYFLSSYFCRFSRVIFNVMPLCFY